jgi:DNA-binding SARP family transcriptional activator/nucleoid-associated protein YgaU
VTRPPERLRRLGRAAAGLGALAAVLAGPPYALVRLTGWPLPRHLPTSAQLQAFLVRPLSDGAIIDGLALAVWVLWALAAAAVLIEAAAALAGRPAPRLPVIAPFQAVAAAVIGATILTTLQVPQAAPRASQPLHAALTASTTVAGPLIPGQPASAAEARSPQAPGSRDAPAARPRVYRVVPGDDLWQIAARFLGNGERWHELFRLNEGKPQPDGRTLTDPSLIYPGWYLLLAPPGGHNGSHPGHHSQRPAHAPTPSPSPSRPRHREGSGSTPSPSPADTLPQPRPVAVHLPSGALIGISVAIMVAAALTLASIQRRRRYRPRPGQPGSLQPGEPPLPAVITALRRAARPAPPGTADDEDGPDTSPPPVTDPYLDPYADTSPGPGQHGEAAPASSPAPPPEPPSPAGTPPPAGTGAPPAREPGTLPLGVRGTSEAALDIAALGGLGLTGPGAPAAARAILAALLAQAQAAPGPPPPVIIPAADAARLLPGEEAAQIPGVSVPDTLHAALDEMEAALLSQARQVSSFDASDQAHATEAAGTPGPGAALIATSDPATTQRLRGILESGRSLGTAAILLGTWPPGLTCQVAADGIITATTPPGAGQEGIRLFHLGADEAAAITAVLREARGTPPAEPPLAPPASPPAQRTAQTTHPARTASTYLPAPVRPAPPGPAHVAGAPPERPPPAPVPPAPPTRTARAADGTATSPDTARPVQLTMLGPLRVAAAGQEIGGGLRKARELMAFLAVNPDGASAEAIGEALWPGADPAQATGQRNLALRKARDMLRGATGQTTPMWITHASGRYRLDPTLISTDLWQFTSALDQARNAATDEDRLSACREAAGLYHGELAEGECYDWAEPYAETARRRALDAWTTIADILAPQDPGQALAALESALGHDPYNEYLYQKIMRLQATAGHPEAVRRTLSLLETRLSDLGITPGTQTRHVAASLLGTHNPPPPRAGHRLPHDAAPGGQPHERRPS